MIIKHRGTSTDMQESNKNRNIETAKQRRDTIDDTKKANDTTKGQVKANLLEGHALVHYLAAEDASDDSLSTIVGLHLRWKKLNRDMHVGVWTTC